MGRFSLRSRSTLAWKSSAFCTASCAISTITSPALSRLSAAGELASTLRMTMPLTVSRILNFLRRSSLRLARSMPSVRVTTGAGDGGSASGLVSAACFSVSSRRPSVTIRVSSLPLRMKTTATSLPTGASATTRGRSRISRMSLPSNLMITSPGRMPAGPAGPRSSTPATSAPRAGLIPRLSAISSVTAWMRTPSQPRRVSPNSLS